MLGRLPTAQEDLSFKVWVYCVKKWYNWAFFFFFLFKKKCFKTKNMNTVDNSDLRGTKLDRLTYFSSYMIKILCENTNEFELVTIMY